MNFFSIFLALFCIEGNPTGGCVRYDNVDAFFVSPDANIGVTSYDDSFGGEISFFLLKKLKFWYGGYADVIHTLSDGTHFLVGTEK